MSEATTIDPRVIGTAHDKAGITIAAGSVCIYVGDDAEYRGERVIVRRIHRPDLTQVHERTKKLQRPFGLVHLRVDDAVNEPDEACAYRWSAWVNEDDLVSIAPAESH